MQIGIFGITGNPPHKGHWQAIKEAAEKCDEVWVTPVFNHAFEKKFIAYEDRLTMLNLLLEELPLKNVLIKQLDKEYYEIHEQTVYSYNLLKFVKEKYPEHDFKLIIGEDNYSPAVWSKFYKHEGIDKEFGIILVEDKGFHSTNLREMISNNQEVYPFVGKKIANFIKENNLYHTMELKKCKM